MFAVILLQELIAGRTARRIAFKFADPATARPLRVTIAVQVATVLLMCPMMSLVAAIVFKADAAAPLYAKWLMTFLFNLPMAMLWQLLVAGPLVRGVIKRVP